MFAGLPCVFVRLTACNLRCVYCDTPHAFNQGETMTLEDVVARSLPRRRPRRDHGRGTFTSARGLSADEPPGRCRQDGPPRDQRSHRHRRRRPRVRVILDIKTPGSGEVDANVWSNLDRLRPTDELKFVICDRADFDWAAGVVRKHRLTGHCPVLFSAVFGQVNPTDLAAWILESRLPVRLQLQQHKILWDPKARGV